MAKKLSTREKNYNYGYAQAMRGVPFDPALAKYAGYEEGWDAGNCDRPTPVDELLPRRSRRFRPTPRG